MLPYPVRLVGSANPATDPAATGEGDQAVRQGGRQDDYSIPSHATGVKYIKVKYFQCYVFC